MQERPEMGVCIGAPAGRSGPSFPCCHGAQGSLHFVASRLRRLVRVGEGEARAWLLFRVRAHNYAGWGEWVEQRSPVAYP